MNANYKPCKKADSTPSDTRYELPGLIAGLQHAVAELVQKQSALVEKLDQFINKVMAHEERLKQLEGSVLNHLESATWIKAAIRFCPLLIVALLFSHQIHALLLNYRMS